MSLGKNRPKPHSNARPYIIVYLYSADLKFSLVPFSTLCEDLLYFVHTEIGSDLWYRSLSISSFKNHSGPDILSKVTRTSFESYKKWKKILVYCCPKWKIVYLWYSSKHTVVLWKVRRRGLAVQQWRIWMRSVEALKRKISTIGVSVWVLVYN